MSWPDRRLILEVIWALGLARLIILTISIHRIIWFINLSFMRRSALIPSADRKLTCDIRRIGYTIHRVSRYTPWRSKCLEQALAGLLLLRYRGIVGTFHLGVAKDHERLIAHAWLSCGKAIITGGNGLDRFVPIYVSGEMRE